VPEPEPLTVFVTCNVDLIPEVTCIASLNGGTGPYTFQWSVDGTPVPGGTDQSLTVTLAPPGNHVIAVTVTDSNGSSASDSLAINVP
jgi:hypothetical protein